MPASSELRGELDSSIAKFEKTKAQCLQVIARARTGAWGCAPPRSAGPRSCLPLARRRSTPLRRWVYAHANLRVLFAAQIHKAKRVQFARLEAFGTEVELPACGRLRQQWTAQQSDWHSARGPVNSPQWTDRTVDPRAVSSYQLRTITDSRAASVSHSVCACTCVCVRVCVCMRACVFAGVQAGVRVAMHETSLHVKRACGADVCRCIVARCVRRRTSVQAGAHLNAGTRASALIIVGCKSILQHDAMIDAIEAKAVPSASPLDLADEPALDEIISAISS